MTLPSSHAAQRGVALLLALWALALVSLIMLDMVGSVRLENQESLHQLQQLRARLLAEAGLALAVMHLSEPSRRQRWEANGQPYEQQLADGLVRIRIHSELGKLDLNSASPALSERLARGLGATAAQARQLARALAERQVNPATEPLHVLEQATQLPGISPELFLRLQPYLTVWSGADEPVPGLAAPAMRAALGALAASAPVAPDPGRVFTVDSQGLLDNGTRASLSATFLLTLDGGTQAYRLLRWQP